MVTEGEQEYVITFGSECGDILDIEPRPESLAFTFTYRTCGGAWSATTQEIRLVRIGKLVFVDPGATPSNQVGRDRWRVVGYADDVAGAKLRIVQLGAADTPDLTAIFRGSPNRHDALVYWTGSIEITVEPNGCNQTWYHDADDVDAWKVLENCPDGC